MPINDEFSKEDLSPELRTIYTSNQLILLFLEKLCKYSESIGIEEFESSILACSNSNVEMPSIDELRQSYRTITEISNDVSSSISKGLIKKKLQLFKVIIHQ